MLGKRMVKEHSQISKHYKEQGRHLRKQKIQRSKRLIDFESWD